MVDFLVQNSGASDKRTKSGSTPLHYCAMYGKTEPAKLLLRAGQSPSPLQYGVMYAIMVEARIKLYTSNQTIITFITRYSS